MSGGFKALAVLLIGSIGGGCTELIYDDYDDDYYGDRHRYPHPRVDYDLRVPRDARLVAQGDGILRFRAPSDGRIYLMDGYSRNLIDSRPLFAGSEYVVAPKDDRAWIDEKRVLEFDFERGRPNRLYFDSDRGRYDDRYRDGYDRDRHDDRYRERHRDRYNDDWLRDFDG